MPGIAAGAAGYSAPVMTGIYHFAVRDEGGRETKDAPPGFYAFSPF